MIRVVRDKLAEEFFFVVAVLLALITSLINGFRLDAIDWHVIVSLFVLMGYTLAFEKYGLLDALAIRVLSFAKNTRQLNVLLTLFTAFLAIWVTNDVALITMVPLTLTVAKRSDFNPLQIVIAQTMAANVGSSLTPFGNPQNLYLFSFYNLEPLAFMRLTLPVVSLGMGLILIYTLLMKNHTIANTQASVSLIALKAKVWILLVIFGFCILGVLKVVPFNIVFAMAGAYLLFTEGMLLLKIDYFLLGTFLACFITIDNITQVPWITKLISPFLGSTWSVILSAALVSQGISNVPSAILLSGFTPNAPGMILGVTIGGLGTLVASLANLISYKFYFAYDKKAPYKRTFIKINIIIAVLILVLIPFIYKF